MSDIGDEARKAQVRVVRRILSAILETVVECGDASEGILFLALQSSGFPGASEGLAKFNMMLSELEKHGLIKRDNHLVTATPKGIEFIQKGGPL